MIPPAKPFAVLDRWTEPASVLSVHKTVAPARKAAKGHPIVFLRVAVRPGEMIHHRHLASY